MLKPVLITGGSGLLAINWAQAIKAKFPVLLSLHKREIELSGTKNVILNMESAREFAESVEELKPSVVIHTAGLTNVEKCELNPKHAYLLNVDLSKNVAKACLNTSTKLVHISTDHLFSGLEMMSDEMQSVAPVNVYGKTKALAEDIVLKENPEAIIVRTNFFGWGTKYRKSFSDVIIESLRCGERLTLFKDVFFTPILIEKLAMLVHELVELNATGIFNVVSDERLSKYEFGILVAKRFGLNLDQISPGYFSDQRNLVQRPLDMSLSNKKISELLGQSLGSVSSQIERLFDQENVGFRESFLNL